MNRPRLPARRVSFCAMRHLPHPNLRQHAFVLGVALLSIVACQPATAVTSGLSPAAATPETAAASVKSPESGPTQIAASGSLVAPLSPTQTAGERIDLSGPPSSPTPLPTVTSTPTQLPTATPTPTDTPSPTPTATPIGPCDQRDPGDELLALVTLEYGLSRDYVPSDLVPISGFFSNAVTLGYPTEIRQPVLEPLREMINDMLDEGLQPMIISGYRSYATQALAWNKWREQEPDRAQILSAPPGYSEHQLGTTIDFGSPELADIVGQEDIQFHTHFYMTRESIWLAENAHGYGFTLSYPREAFDLTGFYYEPWHYRYVGVELATYLKEQGLFLAQYLFETQPLPCIP